MPSVLSAFRSTPTPTNYDDGRVASVGRPRDVRSGVPVHEQERMYALPRHPLAYITMYQGMLMNIAWRFSVETKTGEKFRRRMHVVPNFTAKCKKCKAELHNVAPDQKCPIEYDDGICDGELRPPSRKEIDMAERLMKSINLNGEHLCDVMEQIEPDICVTDEGYLIKRKEYVYDKEGNIRYYKIKETIWGSPIVMRPVVDHRTGTPGGLYYVCPGEHRNDKSVLVLRDKDVEKSGSYQLEPGNYETEFDAPLCPECEEKGMKVRMKDVKYVSIFHERGEIENYYIDGEVQHWHEYMKSHTFSVPPGLTLWVASNILTYKDAYIRDSYYKQRKPRGALVVSTSNPDDFMNTWDSVNEKVKRDWHYMPVIPFEPEPGMTGVGSQRIAWVDFMGTMMDLDYEKIRNIYERMIYMYYGISNIYANLNIGSSAKAASEDKLLVTNRKMERSINISNEQLFILGWEYGLRDCHWEIVPPEDRDVMKELQIQSHKISNSQMMETMDYKAEFDPRTKEFSYKPHPIKETNNITNLIGTLSAIFGGSQPQAGGVPDKPPVTVKPKVDSSEFSGTSNELDKGCYYMTDDGTRLFSETLIEKALADKNMHEGDTKPTTQSQSGSPSTGYYAPDGAGPFKNKQALGGYLRTRGGGKGQAMAGATLGGSSTPGSEPGGMMGVQLDPDDHEKLLDILIDEKMVNESAARAYRKAIEYARKRIVDQENDEEQGVQRGSEGTPSEDGTGQGKGVREEGSVPNGTKN